MDCEDILLNFIVSDVTGLPPIKATHRTWTHSEFDQTSTKGKLFRPPDDGQISDTRSICVQKFVDDFGYVPLRHSVARMDPMLFKDDMNLDKKRYKKIEASDP